MGRSSWVLLREVGLPPITFADEDENEEEDEWVTVTSEDEYDDEAESNISLDGDWWR